MNDPAVGAIPINYTTDQVLPTTGRAIYISTAGALSVQMQDNSLAVFSGLLAGQIYAIAVRTIFASGSTAAGIVLL